MQNQVLVLVAALLLPLYLVWGRLELTDTFRLMPRRGSQFGSSIDVAVTAIRLRYRCKGRFVGCRWRSRRRRCSCGCSLKCDKKESRFVHIKQLTPWRLALLQPANEAKRSLKRHCSFKPTGHFRAELQSPHDATWALLSVSLNHTDDISIA